MVKNVKWILVLIGFFFVIKSFSFCKKEEQAEGTDQELFDLAKSAVGFNWYKNSATLLNKSTGSAHPQPFLKTRFNSVASAKLDASGKIMSGATFPEGSLIVKELYTDATTLVRYALLYKKSGSADADAKGWVWGYINADGTVAEAASKKGTSCISCHSQSGSIDYMLMNKFFP